MPEEYCSAATYSSADQSTTCQFSQASVGASQSCEAGQPFVPCDLDEIILEPVAASRKEEYKLINWEFVKISPPVTKRAISLVGRDRSAPAQKRLEVVADRRGTAAVTKIKAHIQNFASHDGSHAAVRIRRPYESDIVKTVSGADTIEFPVYRTSLGDGLNSAAAAVMSLTEKYFTFALEPAIYHIDVETCGVRNSGRTVGSGHLEVAAYPGDQFALKLKLPPLGKYSYSKTSDLGTGQETITKEGRFRDTSVKTVDQKNNMVMNSPSTFSRTSTEDGWADTRTETFGPDGSPVITLELREKPPEQATIEFSRNGLADDATVNLNKILQLATSAQKRAEAIRELIKQWVPQIGFKFDVGVSFLEGSIGIAWGWKEAADHECFFGISANFSLWLFKITLSASFGISIGPAAMRVVGEIPGAGVRLDAKWDVRGPKDSVCPADAKAYGLIPAEFRGEAVFDIVACTWKAAAGVRSGIEVIGSLQTSEPAGLQIMTTVWWKGIDAFVLTSEPGEGLHEKLTHICDPSKLHEGPIKL